MTSHYCRLERKIIFAPNAILYKNKAEKRMFKCSKILGFTLIEALFSLSLIAVLIFFCIPGNLNFYQKNMLHTAAQEITNIIRYSRTMANVLNTSLILSPIDPKDWGKGMVLNLYNKKQNNIAPIIHQWQWHYKDLQIAWHGSLAKNHLLFSAYLPSGVTNGHFDLTLGNENMRLIVNRLGRVVDQRSN